VIAMMDWLAQIGELPAFLLMSALTLVMVLDAIPLVGVLVPGDVAVLAVIDARGSAGGWAVLVAVIGGCLAGWSLTFLAGRHLGGRIRGSRVGAWIGEARWVRAEGVVRQGGSRVVVVAPFLPVLNALVPLAAGGLRMSYRRFLASAALGSLLWAGLYIVLGVAAEALGDFLPGGSLAMLGTVAIGLTFGWIALLGARRKLRLAGVPASADRPRARTCPRVVTGGRRRRRRQRSTTRPASTSTRRLVRTAPSMRRSWVTRRSVPGYDESADSNCSMAGRSRWLVGSSNTSRLTPPA
jgi:membrane protein DedA with SNARE-associated domain